MRTISKKNICIFLLTIFLGMCFFNITNTYATNTSTEAAGETMSVIIGEGEELNIGGDSDAAGQLEEFIIGSDDNPGFLDIVSQLGFVLIAFGLGQIFLAFKDDNADSKARGAMILLGGVFCVMIKVILGSIGVTL